MFRISHRTVFLFCSFTLLVFGQGQAPAEEVRIAVAANFANCLKELAPLFTETTGHEVVPIVGSTGRHHAQISAGAPFDVFLAADQLRPKLLVAEGLAEASSSFTYAQGRLVFWVAEIRVKDNHDLRQLLADPETGTVAMANPRLAPYGEAARQCLEKMNLKADLKGRIIQGTSVGQAWQFAATGNAGGAFVALSQTLSLQHGHTFPVPLDYYDPLLQQAVLLNSSRNKPAAREFLRFLAGDKAKSIIRSNGYLTPEQED